MNPSPLLLELTMGAITAALIIITLIRELGIL